MYGASVTAPLSSNEDFGVFFIVRASKLLLEANFGERTAVVPEIKGSDYVTGICTFVTDANGPLKNGFKLL